MVQFILSSQKYRETCVGHQSITFKLSVNVARIWEIQLYLGTGTYFVLRKKRFQVKFTLDPVKSIMSGLFY